MNEAVQRHEQENPRKAGLFNKKCRFNKNAASTKKAGSKPAFSTHVAAITPRSIFGDDRSTPTIVDANGQQIGVTANTVAAKWQAGRRDREVGVVVGDEQMVVFKCRRPVRSEAEFDASADRTAPSVVARSGCDDHTAGKDI